jgi:hypothetical protein
VFARKTKIENRYNIKFRNMSAATKQDIDDLAKDLAKALADMKTEITMQLQQLLLLQESAKYSIGGKSAPSEKKAAPVKEAKVKEVIKKESKQSDGKAAGAKKRNIFLDWCIFYMNNDECVRPYYTEDDVIKAIGVVKENKSSKPADYEPKSRKVGAAIWKTFNDSKKKEIKSDLSKSVVVQQPVDNSTPEPVTPVESDVDDE